MGCPLLWVDAKSLGSTVTGEGMTLGLGCGMGEPTSISFRIDPVSGARIRAHRYRAVPNSHPLSHLDISLIALGIKWVDTLLAAGGEGSFSSVCV